LASTEGVVRGLWFRMALVAAIGLGMFLRSQHMTDVTSRSPDERVYTDHAACLADGGVPCYRQLFAVYNADRASWDYPTPSRVSYVFLATAVMQATGTRNPRAGAAVSWFFSILSLVLLAWLGIRFLNRWIAVLAVAFLACSFGELAMARRAWQDSFFGFLGLALVYLTCEITRAPHRKSLYFALFAVGTCSLLNKESAYVSYGICGLWLAGTLLLRERSWKLFGALLLTGAASVAATLGVWAIVAGGITPAVEATMHVFYATQRSAYDARYCSGPWYQFFYLLWITGPVTALMALAGAVLALFSYTVSVRDRLAIQDCQCVRLAALMTAVFLGLVSFGPNLQNLRYISPASATCCLLAGMGFWYLLSLARTVLRLNTAVVLLAAVCLAFETVRNYHAFTQVVVGSGLQDLAVVGIRAVMRR
jgi:4-amino-4-deoxy-L-arabinose transferase-like glycosyltransferase